MDFVRGPTTLVRYIKKYVITEYVAKGLYCTASLLRLQNPLLVPWIRNRLLSSVISPSIRCKIFPFSTRALAARTNKSRHSDPRWYSDFYSRVAECSIVLHVWVLHYGIAFSCQHNNNIETWNWTFSKTMKHGVTWSAWKCHQNLPPGWRLLDY